MNNENYYWLFSTATQSIAALVAFILAGVTLAFSMMDGLVEKDETMTNIIYSLKRKQYSRLVWLSIFAAIAIISSLFSIYINSCDSLWGTSFRIIAIVSDLITIVYSMVFVIGIIDPERYKKEANELYSKLDKEIAPKTELKVKKSSATESGEEISRNDSTNRFLYQFDELEQDIWQYIEVNKLYSIKSLADFSRMSLGIMTNILFNNGKISEKLRNLLIEVYNFRNYIVHGNFSLVSANVMEMLNLARGLWEQEKINQ
jgi:hypothetical protein